MSEHVIENSSLYLLYQDQDQEKNKYNHLKNETVQKLNILGTKIDQCLDLISDQINNEEKIILMIKSIQLIQQELSILKNDITLLKDFQHNI